MPKPDVILFRGQPWMQSWTNPTHYRPGPDGHQREENFPNVRWLDHSGVIHQASGHTNLTLCELDKRYRDLLTVYVSEVTENRVTCVMCMGYPTWKDYPVE